MESVSDWSLDRTTPSPIMRGIDAVGTGVRASTNLSSTLVTEIISQVKSGQAPLLQQGAFFGALITKGVSPEETRLEDVFSEPVFSELPSLVNALGADAPDEAKNFCYQLARGERLSRFAAHRLGQFLFSDSQGEGLRGFAVSILRVRYETADECEGLLQAMMETLKPSFCEPVPVGSPIVQLAEPFDGVDHSYLLTPLIANAIQKLGYRVVSVVGQTSGPKRCLNLWDLVPALGGRVLKGNREFQNGIVPFGWFADQQVLSPAISRWIARRRLLVKRPFLATLEKFVNPFRAAVLVSSAFHPPYVEKMIELGKRAGFQATITVRRGQEGTLAFPLRRNGEIVCSVFLPEGTKVEEVFSFVPEPTSAGSSAANIEISPRLSDNTELIKRFAATGDSGNAEFNRQAALTIAGYEKIFQWLKPHLTQAFYPREKSRLAQK